MKIKLFFASLLLATSFISHDAKAAITITSFSLTETSVSFQLFGTFPEMAPPDQPFGLSFVNPDVSADPGFIVDQGSSADSQSFDGTQTLANLTTGFNFAGNYFAVAFQDDISTGESISGIFTATWDAATFDPGAIASLNVYWGSDLSLPLSPSTQPSAITGGTYLTTVGVVPEPSTTVLLIGAATLAFALRRRFCRA